MRKAWFAATAITSALMISGYVAVVADDTDGSKMLGQHRGANGHTVLDTDGDYSRLAGNLNLLGRVGGDVSLVAGDVDMDDMDIGGELSIAAGDVNFSGSVGGEASIAGGDVNWDGTAHGELSIAAGNLNVTGRMHGPAHLAAGNLEIDGWFGDALNARGGEIELSGEVIGPVELISANRLRDNRRNGHGAIEISGILADGGRVCARTLEIAGSAQIAGTLHVWTESEPVMASGADVENLVYHAREGRECEDIFDRDDRNG